MTMLLPADADVIEVHHEADQETLAFATDADADSYALAVDEDVVAAVDDLVIAATPGPFLAPVPHRDEPDVLAPGR